MSTPTITNPLTKIGDVIRGSLIADSPQQIPHLLQAIAKQVTAQGGKFYIKNFWDDPKPLSLGYVGVHIKIRMPIPPQKANGSSGMPSKGRYILLEVQLHVKAIMDGTEDCAKEIAHRLYKAPKEAGEEALSPEVISSSQLVYLTSMTKLLSSKEDLERVESTLHLVQAATKADKKMRLILETAMLLHDKGLGNRLGPGEWNERLQVIVPKDKEAVAVAWMETARKINQMINLPIVRMDERDDWTNTATSVQEIYADATEIAPFFHTMCRRAADSQPSCSLNFGPGNGYMIKKPESLLDKMQADREEELGRSMIQLLQRIGKSWAQVTESYSAPFKRCSELQSLNFSDCSQVTDSDLRFLESLSALQSLNLSGCNLITDVGLAQLERLTGLRNLNLSGCSLITDMGLEHLWRPTQSLNLCGCNAITDAGLIRAGLQRLNLSKWVTPEEQLRRLRLDPLYRNVAASATHWYTALTSLARVNPGVLPKTIPALPADILQILDSRCPIYADQTKPDGTPYKIQDTHVLALVPEEFGTLNQLEETVLKPYEKANYRNETPLRFREDSTSAAWARRGLGKDPFARTHWVLMSKDVLPGSRNNSWNEQVALIDALRIKAKVAYQPPTLQQCIAIFVTYKVATGDSLYQEANGETLTNVREKDGLDRNAHWVFGGSCPSGVYANYHAYHHHQSIGIAALWKSPFAKEPLVDLQTQASVCQGWITPEEQLKRLGLDSLEKDLAASATHWYTALTHLARVCPRVLPKTIPSLPANILQILDSRCPIYERQIKPDGTPYKIKDTHILALVPEEFGTLNQLEETVLEPYEKANYLEESSLRFRHFADSLREVNGRVPFARTHWILMCKNVLPGSQNKGLDQQVYLVDDLRADANAPYEFPTLQQSFAVFVTYKLATGKSLYLAANEDNGNVFTFTHVKEMKRSGHLGFGGSALSGLHVTDKYAFGLENIGVAPLRKFTIAEESPVPPQALVNPGWITPEEQLTRLHLSLSSFKKNRAAQPKPWFSWFGEQTSLAQVPPFEESQKELAESATHWYTALTRLAKVCPRVLPKAIPPLPEDILQILDSRCPIYGDTTKPDGTHYKIKDTHVLALVPEEFGTLNQLEETVLKPYEQANYPKETPFRFSRYLGNDDVLFTQTHWVMMSKEILPRSVSESLYQQAALIEALKVKANAIYEPPTLQQCIAIFVTYKVATDKSLYKEGNFAEVTRVKWHLHFGGSSSRVTWLHFGGSSPRGVDIFEKDTGYSIPRVIGIAALRKFTAPHVPTPGSPFQKSLRDFSYSPQSPSASSAVIQQEACTSFSSTSLGAKDLQFSSSHEEKRPPKAIGGLFSSCAAEPPDSLQTQGSVSQGWITSGFKNFFNQQEWITPEEQLKRLGLDSLEKDLAASVTLWHTALIRLAKVCPTVFPKRIPSLPADILQILDSICPIYRGLKKSDGISHKIKDTHVLALVPEEFGSLNQLQESVLKPYEKANYPKETPLPFASEEIQKEHGDVPFSRTHWVLMTKDVLPGSRNKNRYVQEELVYALRRKAKVSYEFPTLQQGFAIFVIHKVATGNSLYQSDGLYGDSYIIVKERWLLLEDSSFNSGVRVKKNSGNSTLGAAALRQL